MTNPRAHSLALVLAIAAAGCDKANTAGEGDAQAMVTIRPDAVTLAPGQSAEFSVLVNGAVTSILWSVVETAGGTVSQDGVYTAPSRPGVFHVVAVVIDQNHTARSATAEVTVTNRARGSRDGGPSQRPRDGSSVDTRIGGARDVGARDMGLLDTSPRDLGIPDGKSRDLGTQDGDGRDLESQETGEDSG